MASILIVDDDAHIARVLSIWLQRNGHHARIARSGDEAMEVLENETVDLVISDLNMPRMDGLELALAIRERRGSELPVIILTARCDQAALAEKFRGLSASLFAKPFLPSQLVLEIERRLGAEAR